MDYSRAYKDMREVFDTPCIQKALEFATHHPDVVYGKDSPEYNAVVHNGYFDLYFSIRRSTEEDVGA
jgi:hypothetical protein